MKPRRPQFPAPRLIAVCFCALCASPHLAVAQNLVTNGDFAADANLFTEYPGYVSAYYGPPNPSSIPGWGGGSGINGSSAPHSAFSPVNNAPHYAFIHGDLFLNSQLNSPLTVGQGYLFSFEAAKGFGHGQSAGVYVYSNNHHGTADLVLDGDVVGSWGLSDQSFQKYAFAFKATETTQTIQFNTVGQGDQATDIDKVSVIPISSTITVPQGTTFFTETSGSVSHSFSLPEGQVFFQRPGSVTYTGNITGTGNGGNDAWSIHSAGRLAGAQNLTFSGSTINLGNKVLSIRGNMSANAGNVLSLADANAQMTTFHNANLTTSSHVWVSRGAIKFSGTSTADIAGTLSQHADGSDWAWGSLIMQDSANVYVASGVTFNNVGANLAFNGGTLTTPAIWGNSYTSEGIVQSRTIFNGTRIVASQNHASFLQVSTDFNESATNGTAYIGNGGAIFDTQGFDINISPPLANLPGNAGTLQKLGAGSLSLSGVNTYSGGTTVSEGKLRANNPNALGSGAVTVASGGSLMLWWNTGSSTIANNFTLNGPGAPSLVGTGTKSAIYADGGSGGGFAEYTLAGTITLATNSSLGGTYDNQLRVTGQITGPGGLAKGADRADEYGVLILANPANNYAGDTTINKGTIRLAANEVIPHGVGFGNVSISAGTALDLAGFSETINGLTGTGSVTLGIGSLSVGAANISSSFGGNVSGNGALTKIGTGTLTLTASNSHTGTTTVSGGVLRLDHATALPGGIGASGGTSALTLSGGVVGLGAGNFTRGLGTGVTQVQFTGSSGFAAFGADRSVNLGGASAGVTWAGGSFVPNGSSLIFGTSGANHQLDFQNPINLAGATRTVQVHNGAAAIDAVLSGALSGTGASGLTKTGDGTLALSGVNTYTGATTISAGVLLLNRGTADNSAIATDGVAATTDITISGGTLQLAQSEQIGNSGRINMTSGAFNFGSATGKVETIGAFTNSGGTFSTGANTLIGTGNTITWSGGTNTVNDGGNVQDAHIVISGGTNTVQGGATGGVLQVLTGGTGLEMSNGSTLTLNSDNAVAGKLLLQGNVSTSGNSTVTIASAGAGTNAGNIDLGGGTRSFTVADGSAATDLHIGAVITNGALTKEGAGTLALSGTNTYTGATTVSAGKLLVNSSISNSAVTVQNPGTILATDAAASFGGTVTIKSGAILAIGDVGSAGTATVAGDTNFESGSIFSWDLNTAGADTSANASNQGTYDKLTGNATGTGIFKVVLGTGDYSDFFWATDKTWSNIFAATSTVAFLEFAGDYVGPGGYVDGFGSFAYNSGTATLSWSAIPEPSSVLAGLLLGAGLLRRRRRVEVNA